MIELTQDEVCEITGGKFRIKLHFNPFVFLGSVAAGFIAGGPFGVGLAVGSMLITQGSGNLYDLHKEQFGN
jgi:hypothetical protein